MIRRLALLNLQSIRVDRQPRCPTHKIQQNPDPPVRFHPFNLGHELGKGAGGQFDAVAGPEVQRGKQLAAVITSPFQGGDKAAGDRCRSVT